MAKIRPKNRKEPKQRPKHEPKRQQEGKPVCTSRNETRRK
jgi:hypothetical protein